MTTLKLWTVRLETEIVVLAESAGDAEREAIYAARHDVDDLDAHAAPMRHLPGEWDLDAIPFGERLKGEPDRTVGQWIEAGAAPEYRK